MSIFVFSNYAYFWYITTVLMIVFGSFIDTTFPIAGYVLKCSGYIQIIEIMLLVLWLFLNNNFDIPTNFQELKKAILNTHRNDVHFYL